MADKPGVTQIPGDAIVRKHNVLIEAKHTQLLDVRAMRLVAVAASLITPKDNDFKTYHIPVKEITNSPDVYSKVTVGNDQVMLIDKITDQLVAGVLKIPKKNADGTRTGESFVKYAYFSKCQYIKGTGYIEVEFHPDLKEFYLDLKGNYTQMSRQILKRLPGSYSFRLYELLKQYAQGGIFRREFLLDELFDMLAIRPHTPKSQSSYRNWGKFREKVILPAQGNFKRHTDLTFDFRGRAQHGRAFTHIEFIMRKNKKFLQGDLFPEKKDDQVIDLIPQQILDKIPPLQWQDKEIGCKRIVEEILDSQGVEALQFYVDYLVAQDTKSKIESWGKYMRSCWREKLYEAHVMKKVQESKKKKTVQAEQQKHVQAIKDLEGIALEEIHNRERLDKQVEQVLAGGHAQDFLLFVANQVDEHESPYMAKRFRNNKGCTKEDMYRRYVSQFLEENQLPAENDSDGEEDHNIVSWLESF